MDTDPSSRHLPTTEASRPLASALVVCALLSSAWGVAHHLWLAAVPPLAIFSVLAPAMLFRLKKSDAWRLAAALCVACPACLLAWLGHPVGQWTLACAALAATLPAALEAKAR